MQIQSHNLIQRTVVSSKLQHADRHALAQRQLLHTHMLPAPYEPSMAAHTLLRPPHHTIQAAQVPEGFWPKLHWAWELPLVKSIRITLSVANWGVRLPAIAALILTQGGILASQLSVPMLAPLLLGTGVLIRSIKTNASFIIPRMGLLMVMLWTLWFIQSVIQNTWLVLRKQVGLLRTTVCKHPHVAAYMHTLGCTVACCLEQS